jgi:ankyrin repeat protein
LVIFICEFATVDTSQSKYATILPDEESFVPQEGWSCLYSAAHKGHLSTVKYLCELGNEKLLFLRDNNQNTACGIAEMMGHVDIYKYLYKLGLEP